MRDLLAALLVAVPIYLAAQRAPVLAAPPVAAQAAFEAMADAERAFVRAAAEKGVLAAFIAYFADDAIAFEKDAVVRAQAGLRRQLEQARSREVQGVSPPPPMQWEPRAGDIAASGDLGWLTGPVTRAGRDGQTVHSCYFSVWRPQADGTYRVLIDTGIRTPSAVPFAPGLTRAAHESRYAGAEGGDAAAASLAEADRALVRRTTTHALGDAYGPLLAPVSRLHRDLQLPVTGRAAILQRLAPQPALAASGHRGSGASAAGDLGYTYGTYTTAGATPEHGWYLRVWTREASGAWKVVADITQPQAR